MFDHGKHIQIIEENLKRKPQYLWRYVKDCFGCSKEQDCAIEYKSQLISTPKKIANIFSQQFASVSTHSKTNNNTILQPDLCDAIKKFRTSMSVGPDLIPGPFVKACAELFARTLASIFCNALRSEFFTNLSKKAYVVPIRKSEKQTDYKTVSLLCVFS